MQDNLLLFSAKILMTGINSKSTLGLDSMSFMFLLSQPAHWSIKPRNRPTNYAKLVFDWGSKTTQCKNDSLVNKWSRSISLKVNPNRQGLDKGECLVSKQGPVQSPRHEKKKLRVNHTWKCDIQNFKKWQRENPSRSKGKENDLRFGSKGTILKRKADKLGP